MQQRALSVFNISFDYIGSCYDVHNSWRTEHTATASPPGSSTSSCSTYGRFQHLRVTVSPNLSGQKSLLLLPSDTWSQESLRDWIPSSRSLSLKSLFLRLPHFLRAPTQNSKYLEKSTRSCNP